MEVIPPKKNWFERNWLWFIPLTGILILSIVISLLISSAYNSVKSFFTGFNEQLTATIPVNEAMQRVVEYEYLNQVLGSPITSLASKKTNFKIHNGLVKRSSQTLLKGPLGTGVLYLTVRRKGEEWEFLQMYVLIDATGEEVELLYDNER